MVRLNAKYKGKCSECEARHEPEDVIYFDPKNRRVYCQECGEELLDEDEQR